MVAVLLTGTVAFGLERLWGGDDDQEAETPVPATVAEPRSWHCWRVGDAGGACHREYIDCRRDNDRTTSCERQARASCVSQHIIPTAKTLTYCWPASAMCKRVRRLLLNAPDTTTSQCVWRD